MGSLEMPLPALLEDGPSMYVRPRAQAAEAPAVQVRPREVPVHFVGTEPSPCPVRRLCSVAATLPTWAMDGFMSLL